VLKKAIPMFDLLEQYINKVNTRQLTYEFEYKYALNQVLVHLETIVKMPTIRMYYKTQDYLIFMSLANYFEFYVNFKYSVFLVKHTDKYNKKLPSNLSKFGKLSEVAFERNNYIWEFVKSHMDDKDNKYTNLKQNSVVFNNENYKDIDYV